ncbi:hypothetical protein Hanom_Chr01g00083661 [Helianthus anomalus]
MIINIVFVLTFGGFIVVFRWAFGPYGRGNRLYEAVITARVGSRALVSHSEFAPDPKR